MARDAEFKARVTADDQASKTLEEIAATADKLDGKDATVAVAAEDEATPVLEGATEAVETLDGDDATVAVAADDGATETLTEVQGATDALDGADASVAVDADDNASGTLDDVQGATDALDGADAEVAVDADDQATPTLDDVQGAVDTLDGATAEVTATVDDQASGALDDIGSSLGGLTEQLGSLPGPLGEVGGLIGGLGAGGAGAAAGIGAVAAAVGTSISSFEELNIAIGDFVTATGTSFDEASRLIEVTGDIGINADTIEKAIGKMNLAAGKTPEAFDAIGASVVHAKDGTIDVTETFLGVVAALGKIDDAQIRTEEGRKIFGKGWTDMAPLIRQSADDVRASLAAVGDEKIGSAEKTAEADNLRDSLDTLADAADKLKLKFGEALAPAVGGLAEAAGGAVDALAPLATEIGDELAGALEAVTPLIKLFGDSLKSWQGIKIDLPGGDSFKPFTGGIAQAVSAWDTLKERFGSTAKLSGDLNVTTEAVAKAQGEAASKALEHAAALEKTRAEFEATATKLDGWTDKFGLYEVAVGNASLAMQDLGKSVGDIKSDSLQKVFDLGDGPREAAANVRDIGVAIDGLSELAKDVKIGDVIAGNIKADKFLDAIDKLAPQIQSAVSDAFGKGGPEAATKVANEYIDQVTKELGGKFSREQVTQLLGLDGLEAKIQVSLEKSALDVAQRELDELTGLGGKTPYTASIQMALDAGTITPENAQILITKGLGDKGVLIPNTLATPQTADALASAQAQLDAGAPVMTVDADITKAQTLADEAKAYADSLVGTETVAGDAAKARAEAYAAQAYTNSLIGTEGIDGDKARAMAEAAAAQAYTDSLTGTEKVDANSEAAKKQAQDAKTYADSLTANIAVQANTAQANKDIDFAARDRQAKIFVTTSGAGFMLGSTSSSGTNKSAPSSATAMATTAAVPVAAPAAQAVPINVNVPAPVVNVAAPQLPPIVVKLDGRPIAALIGSTTAPAVRAAAMAIRAGRA